MVNLRIHSLKAWVNNRRMIVNQTQLAIDTIRQSGSNGISAKEYAKLLGVCCTHQPCVSSRLSDALKQCNDIEYVAQEGKNSGRYIAKKKYNKFWGGEQ